MSLLAAWRERRVEREAARFEAGVQHFMTEYLDSLQGWNHCDPDLVYTDDADERAMKEEARRRVAAMGFDLNYGEPIRV